MDTRTTLTPTEAIDRVSLARRTEPGAAVGQLRLTVEWALLHPCPANEWPAHWGDPRLDEQVIPLAGVGAPLVGGGAPADRAPALYIAVVRARRRGADPIELVYRLPRLWALVVAGLVPVWR